MRAEVGLSSARIGSLFEAYSGFPVSYCFQESLDRRELSTLAYSLLVSRPVGIVFRKFWARNGLSV